MPDWIGAIVLGIIEGVTEFIPVSSTGHLLLAEHWLKLHKSDLFNVVIQCGAVLAVLPLFPQRITQFLFRWREPATRDYLLKIFAAFAITGAGGVVLEKMDFKLPDNPLPIAIALLVGGVAFVGIERWLRGRTPREDITWNVAIAVAIAQLVAAIFPGTSRSGSTILFALALGLSRPAATEFSFLVGIPTMLAAGSLKIYKALSHPVPGAPSEDWGQLVVASLVAAVVSFVVVKWLLSYVRTHTFTGFGWYRIAVGILILALLR